MFTEIDYQIMCLARNRLCAWIGMTSEKTYLI